MPKLQYVSSDSEEDTKEEIQEIIIEKPKKVKPKKEKEYIPTQIEAPTPPPPPPTTPRAKKERSEKQKDVTRRMREALEKRRSEKMQLKQEDIEHKQKLKTKLKIKKKVEEEVNKKIKELAKSDSEESTDNESEEKLVVVKKSKPRIKKIVEKVEQSPPQQQTKPRNYIRFF